MKPLKYVIIQLEFVEENELDRNSKNANTRL